jgi:hypothetical protein
MSKERELLKEALKVLEWNGIMGSHDTYNSIKELLAQPEQEPVAWCQMVEGKVQDLLTSFEMKDWLYDKSWIPLYTAPSKREPLSDGAICQILLKKEWKGFVELVRIIEKMHGIGVDNESI